MQKLCKVCESSNLKTEKSGPHVKLFCGDCGAYQKFLSKEEIKVFESRNK